MKRQWDENHNTFDKIPFLFIKRAGLSVSVNNVGLSFNPLWSINLCRGTGSATPHANPPLYLKDIVHSNSRRLLQYVNSVIKMEFQFRFIKHPDEKLYFDFGKIYL